MPDNEAVPDVSVRRGQTETELLDIDAFIQALSLRPVSDNEFIKALTKSSTCKAMLAELDGNGVRRLFDIIDPEKCGSISIADIQAISTLFEEAVRMQFTKPEKHDSGDLKIVYSRGCLLQQQNTYIRKEIMLKEKIRKARYGSIEPSRHQNRKMSFEEWLVASARKIHVETPKYGQDKKNTNTFRLLQKTNTYGSIDRTKEHTSLVQILEFQEKAQTELIRRKSRHSMNNEDEQVNQAIKEEDEASDNESDDSSKRGHSQNDLDDVPEEMIEDSITASWKLRPTPRLPTNHLTVVRTGSIKKLRYHCFEFLATDLPDSLFTTVHESQQWRGDELIWVGSVSFIRSKTDDTFCCGWDSDSPFKERWKVDDVVIVSTFKAHACKTSVARLDIKASDDDSWALLNHFCCKNEVL